MIHFGLEEFTPYILYFGGIAAFFASVRRPWIGLYLLVLTLPLQTIRFTLFFLPLGNKFIDILLLGVIIGVLHHEGIAGFGNPLTSLLLLLSVFYYLSLWQGAFYLNGPLPLSFDDPRFSNWKNYVEMFLFCIVTASVIRDKNQAQWLLLVMAVSVLLVNKGYYGAVGDRDLTHFTYEERYAGTLGYAGVNGLGSFETMMAAFFLGIAAYVKRLPVKLGILALVSTCLYCILFSFSREAYLGLLASLILLGILKDRKLLIIVAIVLISWETILPQSVQERIAMTTEDTGAGEQLDASSGRRVELWKDALDLFTADPVVGIGFNTYEFLGRVGGYGDTHNYFVKVLLETGVIGLLLFLWLLGRMWGLGYVLFRRAEDPFWAAIGLGFLALMCSATVVNFFGDRWTYQQLDGYIWILLGCVIRGLIVTRENDHQVEESDKEAISVSSETASAVLTA
jgi:putative inorganic carbon (HCO3(-)) transporter